MSPQNRTSVRAFGRPVEAREVEQFRVPEPEVHFVRLCSTLIAAEIGDRELGYLVPSCSERIRAPDGGIDAQIEIKFDKVSGGEGLIGSGRTIYQFKWREVGDRSRVIKGLESKAKNELSKLRDSGRGLPDRYVFMTNVDLLPEKDAKQKIETALKEGCPEYGERPIIIYGAGEIATCCNRDLGIRAMFFGDSLFCTIEVAREEHKRRFTSLCYPVFMGRAKDRGAIDTFLKDKGKRLLCISGFLGVGKSRLVLEALSSEGGRSVWTSNAELLNESHFRVLDDEKKPNILIIDDCDINLLEQISRWALSRRTLKTILISRYSSKEPGSLPLQIGPLDEKEARELIEKTKPELSHATVVWLLRYTGGNPGLIVQAMGVLDDIPVEKLTVKTLADKIGKALEDKLCKDIPDHLLPALRILATLPKVGVKGKVRSEIETLCQVFNVDLNQVLSSLEVFSDRGLILQHGRYVEVIPPLLAIRLASQALIGQSPSVINLFKQLSDRTKLRFAERIVDLRGIEDIDRIINVVLGPGGLFINLDIMEQNVELFRTFILAKPAESARRLWEIIKQVGKDRLLQCSGNARRQLVWALEALVRRSDAYLDAGRSLLALAEAENETCSNNATGVFTEIFHYQHPEISAPPVDRLTLLKESAKSDSYIRRSIVTRAISSSISGHTSFTLSHSEGPLAPEIPWRAKTWGELWDHIREVTGLLKNLIDDPVKEVAKVAQEQLIECILDLAHMGLLEESVDALESLAQRVQDAKTIARLRDTADFLLEDLKKLESQTEEVGFRERVQKAIQRVEFVLVEITEGNFVRKFKRWLGPKSRIDRHLAIDDKTSHIPIQEAENLADEVLKKPELLSSELLDWLVTLEAQNSHFFFYKLGKEDKGCVWVDKILSRVETDLGPHIFGSYIAGWAEDSSSEAFQYLDELSEKDGQYAKAILDAIRKLSPNKKSIQIIIDLVQREMLEGGYTVRAITWGWAAWQLPPDLFLIVIKEFKKCEGTALALIDLIAHRIHKIGKFEPHIEEVSWDLVGSTVDVEKGDDAYSWDELAAKLAMNNFEWGLKLFLCLLHSGEGTSGRAVAFPNGSRLLEALLKTDRAKLIRRLLGESAENTSVGWSLRMDLVGIINPKQDKELLLNFAQEADLDGVLLVIDCLDLSRDGAWQVVEEILINWGNEEKVKSRLHVRLGTTVHCISGGFSAFYKHRLNKVQPLINHKNPNVVRWAKEVITWLSKEIETEREREAEKDID